MAREVTLQQKLANAVDAVWREHFGGYPNELWSLMTDQQLFDLEVWFWGHHQDLVTEYSRRQMRRADPSR